MGSSVALHVSQEADVDAVEDAIRVLAAAVAHPSAEEIPHRHTAGHTSSAMIVSAAAARRESVARLSPSIIHAGPATSRRWAAAKSP